MARRIRCPLCKELMWDLNDHTTHTENCAMGATLVDMAQQARERKRYARSLRGMTKKEVRTKVRSDQRRERMQRMSDDERERAKARRRITRTPRNELDKLKRRKHPPVRMLTNLLEGKPATDAISNEDSQAVAGRAPEHMAA